MKNLTFDKNPQFYQFNQNVTPKILYELSSHPTALRVLSIFLYCSGPLGTIMLPQKYIHKETHNNRSNISEAIQYLQQVGIIAIIKMGIQNIYVINPGFIWRKSNHLRHAITNNVKFNKLNTKQNIKITKILSKLSKKSFSIIPIEYLKRGKNKK